MPPTLRQQAQKSQLYATVDGGRLHVGLDEHYVGSIDSYNNFITKFVANLLGWSTQITVDGKTRHVDKADYTKSANNNTAHTTATKDALAGFADLHLLEVKVKEGPERMRDYLSTGKSRRLFEKMVVAMCVNKDFEAAKKYASKGANLDDYFWIREGYPIALTTLKADLADDKAIDFRAGYYTPILYAAEKNNKVFCDLLRKLKASFVAQGQYVQFVKKIAEINPITTVEKNEEFTASDGRKLTRLTLKTVSELLIEDQLTPKVDFTFNPETNALSKVESRSPVVIEKYSKTLERITTRYL